MARRRVNVTTDSGPNLTPVVNVAMVVLVVFMLTASFVEAQSYMESDVALTEDGGQAEIPDDFVPPTKVTVLVDTDVNTPSVFVANVSGSGQSASDKVALEEILRAQRVALESTVESIDEMQVEIGPQRAVIWQHLISVYEAAQRAGFSRITFTPAR
jgi:biopolymer transport protein ExbD